MKAAILLAHGSSDPNWLAPFDQLLARIRQQLDDDTHVRLAYMELAQPTLAEQVAELVTTGAHHIDVLPLFFAAGRHLRRDVPAMIEDLMRRHPSVTIELHAPVGLEPEVSAAISQVVTRQLQP
ncbi:cobalamin biosynthesis protein CbiX [Bacterioplanes sanyensis]|uniref:Cobalamin biosynthesis protein CbiX n=1 Tax=Bacterioplanes sanyensis TaxID=1249553 RepID=A0A222FJA7_9GAMM|nr:CbiX/SirB N-terminal domain-containing protein [Bacterioplanes sanyensis]ASP38676.1 cobalamin biosynthesis protein CbiX [Bacterioplanes sanyensis]